MKWCSPAHTLLTRIGRRGAFLLFLALVDASVAYSYTLPEARLNPYLLWLEEYTWPLWIWTVIWGTVSLVCFVQAFMRIDRMAFALASGLKFLVATISVGAWVAGALIRGWVSAVIWLAFGLTVLLISTWPEVRK